jgi:hypothetical protein
MRYQTSIAATLTLTLAALVGSGSSASASSIVEAQGTVEIKRSGWSSYRPVGIGTTIEQGDMVQTAAGATAKVLCDDLTFWQIPSGSTSTVDKGCPSARAKQEHRPGGANVSIPYTISPRYTYLLNGKPTLSWNAVPNAKTYLVKLEGGDLRWQTEVAGTEVVYSGEKPLVAGVQYKFTVEADTGVSSLDGGSANLGFALLREEDVKLVTEEVAKIAQLNLTPEGKAIALAKVYSTFQLHADAIQTLEALAKQGSKSASLYQMLGDIYAGTGLNLLAEQSYSEAVKLASAPQDWSVLSQAQLGLVGVKMILGKTEEAQQIANTIKAGHQQAEDPEMTAKLERSLSMSPQSGSPNSRPSTVTKRGGPSVESPSMENQTEDVIVPPAPKISRPEAAGFS